MAPVAAAAVAMAVLLDLLLAEPPARVHPVALFGRLVAPFDRAWRHPRTVGTLAAVGLPLGAAGLLGWLTAIAAGVHPLAAGGVAAATLFSTTSLRMLLSAGRDVVEATATDAVTARDAVTASDDATDADLDRARTAVRALVGRDASTLSAGELRSAAVESVAENLADGFVAPLFAFALGAQVSLAVGVAGAAWVKAVNTLDSMLGYRSKPVGWASARLDDAVMWLPARLSAVLLALAARDPGALGRARSWAREPPSPNSGWPMATLAAVLHVRLCKPDVYVLNPAAALPTVAEARRGVRVVGVAGVLAAVAGGVVADASAMLALLGGATAWF